jgi:excisionase family DNA binding protein
MKRFYTVKEAANLLSVSTNTIYAYLKTNKVKSKRFGLGRFKIPYSELRPFMGQGDILPSRPSTREVNLGVKIGNSKSTDFVFFKLFLSFIFLGVGLFVPIFWSRYFSILMQVTQGDSLLSAFLIIIYALINLGIGFLQFYRIIFPQRLFKYDLLIRISLLVITALNIYIAAYIRSFESIAFFGSLLLVLVVQQIRGIDHKEKDFSTEKEMIFLAFVSYLAVGLIGVFDPKFFPIEFLRTIISDYKMVFILFWFSSAIVQLILLVLPKFNQNRRNSLFLIIAYLIGYLLVSVSLVFELKWIPLYFSYLSIIFFVFLFLFIQRKKYPDSKAIASLSKSLFTSTLIVTAGILGTSLFLVMVINSKVALMRNKLAEAGKDLDYYMEVIDRRISSEIGSGKIGRIIESRNKEEAVEENQSIFNRIPDVRRIMILDANGVSIGAYPWESLLDGTDLSSREHFQQAKETLRPSTSKIFNSVTSEKIISRAFPVVDEDLFKGVIIVAPDLSALSSKYNKLVDDNSSFYGYEDTGNYIFSPDVTQIGTKVPSNVVSNGHSIDYLTSVVRVFDKTKRDNWTIYNEMSIFSFFKDIWGLNLIIGLLVLGCTYFYFRGVFSNNRLL